MRCHSQQRICVLDLLEVARCLSSLHTSGIGEQSDLNVLLRFHDLGNSFPGQQCGEGGPEEDAWVVRTLPLEIGYSLMKGSDPESLVSWSPDFLLLPR